MTAIEKVVKLLERKGYTDIAIEKSGATCTAMCNGDGQPQFYSAPLGGLKRWADELTDLSAANGMEVSMTPEEWEARYGNTTDADVARVLDADQDRADAINAEAVGLVPIQADIDYAAEEQALEFAEAVAAEAEMCNEDGVPLSECYPVQANNDVTTEAEPPTQEAIPDEPAAEPEEETIGLPCCECGAMFDPDPDKVRAWAQSGRDFDPTDWVCPTCEENKKKLADSEAAKASDAMAEEAAVVEKAEPAAKETKEEIVDQKDQKAQDRSRAEAAARKFWLHMEYQTPITPDGTKFQWSARMVFPVSSNETYLLAFDPKVDAKTRKPRGFVIFRWDRIQYVEALESRKAPSLRALMARPAREGEVILIPVKSEQQRNGARPFWSSANGAANLVKSGWELVLA